MSYSADCSFRVSFRCKRVILVKLAFVSGASGAPVSGKSPVLCCCVSQEMFKCLVNCILGH